MSNSKRRPIVNQCVFSADRRYRYLLIHRWEPELPERPCMWIALNPSIADESRLDNTLTRIRSFSTVAGFNVFYMVNLFALVSTDLRAMKRHPEPVGKDNDVHIHRIAAQFPTIFVAWGANGRHLDRDREVLGLLAQLGDRISFVLAPTKMGHPSTRSIYQAS